MTVIEKVEYLRGLADGLNIDTEKSKEGKLIAAIIDVLEEVGMSIEDLEDDAIALGEELDAISDDLAEVEDAIFDEEEDDEDEDDDCCCGHGHGHHGHHGHGHHGHHHGHCHDEDEDEDFFETECPNCGEPLFIDEAVMEEGVVECPGCAAQFAISDGCDDEDCDCGCEEE